MPETFETSSPLADDHVESDSAANLRASLWAQMRNDDERSSILKRAQEHLGKEFQERWKETPLPENYYGSFRLDQSRLDYKPIPFARTFALVAPPSVGASAIIGLAAREGIGGSALQLTRRQLLPLAVTTLGAGQLYYDCSNLRDNQSNLGLTKYGLSALADTGMIGGGILTMFARTSKLGAVIALSSIAARVLLDCVPDKVGARYEKDVKR
jgi:hypothetical protein